MLDPKSSSHIPSAGVIKEVLNKRGIFEVIFSSGGRLFS